MPSTPVTGTFWQETQPVSVASLPLPAGASDSTRQDTSNLYLSEINSKLPASLGQKTKAESLAVVLPSDQTFDISMDDETWNDTRIVLTLTTQDTGYSYTLPEKTTCYEVKVEQSRDIRVSDSENGLTSNYDILKSGTTYNTPFAKDVVIQNKDLWFKDVNNAGTIVLLRIWTKP